MSSSAPKKIITILGVSGSVGQNAVDVICSAPHMFEVHGVTAGQNVELLAQSAIKLGARIAVIADEDKLEELRILLTGHDIQAACGAKEIEALAGAKDVDLVLGAIMGFAGLRPILAALRAGVNVAVANKEPLVAAGDLVIATAKQSGARILPVDSEHNAIFQVFENQNREWIDKIILTASGGPFLDWDIADIRKATVAQALKHPNWVMGRKISVDSATMMNKALEVIEAHYLFDMPPEKIEVLVHPQSVIHSMVSYRDGSILSQMGASDMRTPIAYALSWPERMQTSGNVLDLTKMSTLSFRQPDFTKFPALRYAYDCLEKGAGYCIALNAANEVAVDLFLSERIAFGEIVELVGSVLVEIEKNFDVLTPKTVEEIEEWDSLVRRVTHDLSLHAKNQPDSH